MTLPDPASPQGLYRSLRQLIEQDLEDGICFSERMSTGLGERSGLASVSGPATQAATAAITTDMTVSTNAPPAQITTDFSAEPAQRLKQLATAIAVCQRCGLCNGRQRTVPGEGDAQAKLLFIGEGPGAEEDASGRPFVGAAGQLLDKMIRGMGLQRDQVFIANIVKCRPPGNRTPSEDEVSACLPYVLAQVDIIAPSVICTLGNTPLRALTGNPHAGITRARGTAFIWRGITVIPTFHPSYLLRNEEAKRPAWNDLKQVMALLGLGATSPSPNPAPSSSPAPSSGPSRPAQR